MFDLNQSYFVTFKSKSMKICLYIRLYMFVIQIYLNVHFSLDIRIFKYIKLLYIIEFGLLN